MDIGNVPRKEFKVMIKKRIKELKRRMNEQSKKLEVLNKESGKYKEQPNRDEEYNN